MRSALVVVVVCALSVGCSNELDPTRNGNNNNGDTDQDSDSDSDRDSDSDSDSDTDTDTVDPFAVDCNADYTANMSIPGPAECVTETITCGETILATTSGGNDFYGFREYEDIQCLGRWGQGDADWSGPERGFYYALAADTQAVFKIHSPCEELKVTKLNNPDMRGDCPFTFGSSCDSRPKLSDSVEDFELTDVAIRNPLDSILIIESPSGTPVNFRISMECPGG